MNILTISFLLFASNLNIIFFLCISMVLGLMYNSFAISLVVYPKPIRQSTLSSWNVSFLRIGCFLHNLSSLSLFHISFFYLYFLYFIYIFYKSFLRNKNTKIIKNVLKMNCKNLHKSNIISFKAM